MPDEHVGRWQMERLWAPWRIEYIRQSRDMDCVLCTAPGRGNDEETLILYRGTWNYIIMNRYPYSPGHLMVAPFKHTAELDELTQQECVEHLELVRLGTRVLKDVTEAGGFNIGLNLGRVAGAGLDQHLHTHIVPRWQGDANFMPVVGHTRVISDSLPSMYARIKRALDERLANAASPDMPN